MKKIKILNDFNYDVGKFNFKKTNATKKLYSCGGYGGTCNYCKLMNYPYKNYHYSKFNQAFN